MLVVVPLNNVGTQKTIRIINSINIGWEDKIKDMKNKDYIISRLRDLRDETPCREEQTACGCEKFDQIIDFIQKNL